MTPYQRGFNDRLAGNTRAPDFPKGDATWEQKLYHRGWMDGLTEQAKKLQPECQGIGWFTDYTWYCPRCQKRVEAYEKH
jgi:hypothetical protein